MSLMQNHLRTYAEDGIKQKIRITNLHNVYVEQESKTRERIIDQTQLVNDFKENNAANAKLDLVERRLQNDIDTLENVKTYVEETRQEEEELIYQLNTHVEELSAYEIASGGFYAHVVGADKNATYERNTKAILLEPQGHAEMPIGIKLNSWKDSNQLTISKRNKRGQTSNSNKGLQFSYYFNTKKTI